MPRTPKTETTIVINATDQLVLMDAIGFMNAIGGEHPWVRSITNKLIASGNELTGQDAPLLPELKGCGRKDCTNCGEPKAGPSPVGFRPRLV